MARKATLRDLLGAILDTVRYHPFTDQLRSPRLRLWYWRRFRPSKFETLRRINLGCGPHVVAGLCNIDVAPGADLRFNLLNAFPLPAAVADVVYCEHTFEHLEAADVRRILGEVHRILRPGGVVRVSVPHVDLGDAAARAGGSGRMWRIDSMSGAELLELNRLVFHHEHRSFYSTRLLAYLMAEAGFEETAAVESGATKWFPQDLLERLELRRKGQVVVEARKN